MKKTILLCILFLLIFSFNLYAIDGKILTTIDYSIEDKWYKTQGESQPIITTVTSVNKEQNFLICIIAGDYSVDKKQNANIVYDISIIDPNNKQHFEAKNITFIKNKVNPKFIQLSQTVLKANFENDKPTGKYLISVTLHDLIDNSSKIISETITLQDYHTKKYFSNDDEFTTWLSNYYEHPSPEKAIDAFLYYTKSKLNEKDSGFAPTFTFFLYIFNNNKYLIPEMVDRYKDQDIKTKIYLIYLFRYVDYDLKSFLENLKDNEKNVYDKINNKPYANNPYDKIIDAGQLDMLWSEFLATGSYRPIYRLTQTLEYKEYEGQLKKYKQLNNPTENDKQKAIYDVIYQAAVWSINSNCKQYKLVNEYCTYILNNVKVSNNVKNELNKILSN